MVAGTVYETIKWCCSENAQRFLLMYERTKFYLDEVEARFRSTNSFVGLGAVLFLATFPSFSSIGRCVLPRR